MIQILKKNQSDLISTTKFISGTWVNLVAPTNAELEKVEKATGADYDFLRAALDREEGTRIETEDKQTLIVVDVPVKTDQEGLKSFETVPVGIIVLDNYIITVSLEENETLSWFLDDRAKNFGTNLKTRFIMQFLRRNALIYLKYLRQIDRKTEEVEKILHRSMKNAELFQMMELQKSLVYFSASLKSNQVVLDRLLKVDRIGRYSEADADFLEEAIIENRQALEMVDIYTNTLNGTMDTFASIIANNQNAVMKFLAGVTIILNVPALVYAFYGQNVSLPGAGSSLMESFWTPLILSVVLAVLATIFFVKKKFFA